jgi:hypothetical protein
MRKAMLVLLLTAATADPASAAWVRTSQLTYNTAHTLDSGELEVGILSPLQYGISDRVQAAIHPVLLLIGAPNLSLRWRVTRNQPLTVALNFSATWSLLRREDALGDLAETGCTTCGNPGQLLVTTTASWAVSKTVLLSLGVGPALDFLDLEPSRFLAEIHGSALWTMTPDQLLMLHVAGFVKVVGQQEARLPVVQLTYARACGPVHVGVGVAIGDFPLARELDQSDEWFLYPVLDVWWRL